MFNCQNDAAELGSTTIVIWIHYSLDNVDQVSGFYLDRDMTSKYNPQEIEKRLLQIEQKEGREIANAVRDLLSKREGLINSGNIAEQSGTTTRGLEEPTGYMGFRGRGTSGLY